MNILKIFLSALNYIVSALKPTSTIIFKGVEETLLSLTQISRYSSRQLRDYHSKNSEYDQEIPQSQTADKPTATQQS